MLTQLDIKFPQVAGEGRGQPNHLRVAAALDMLDILTPVLGSFQPVISRLRDEFVEAIYMPEKNTFSRQEGRGGVVNKGKPMPLNTLKPLSAQRSGLSRGGV